MPADHSSGDHLDLLQQQVEKLTQEYAALSAAYARARRTRQLIFLGTLLFIAVVCFAFYRRGSKLMSEAYSQELAKIAQARLEKNQDQYMRHVEHVVNRTSPALSDAFTQQANKDLPAFFKLLENERDQAAKELQTKMTDHLEKRYATQLERLDQVLTEELPQTKDKVLHDRLAKNLKTAMDRVLKKHYISMLESDVNELYATWDRFPMAETPRKGDPSIETEFMAELQHLLIIKLGSPEAVARR
jgi:hypothetical protein